MRIPPRAEVVGSLLRPARLKSAVESFYADGHRAVLAAEREQDRSELTTIEDEAVDAAIANQIDCGLDIITDGELRRYMFQNSFWDAVEGFSTDRNPVEFRADDGSTITWYVQTIEERLRPAGENPAAHEAAYMASRISHPFKVTFPAASLFALPFTFKPGINDHVYADLEELVDHCVELEAALVAEAVAAGAAAIQFDFPAYPFLVDTASRATIEKIGWSVDRVLELALETDRVIREAVPAGIPVSMHVCRGNNQSRYLCEGALDPVAEAMFSLPYDAFLIEWEDSHRMGDYAALANVSSPGPIIVLGIVSSKRPQMETSDALRRHVDDAATLLPLEQLALSTQCGFASTLPGNELTEDDQWRKLALVGQVAEDIWG